jgi:signal transduction histidine kinase
MRWPAATVPLCALLVAGALLGLDLWVHDAPSVAGVLTGFALALVLGCALWWQRRWRTDAMQALAGTARSIAELILLVVLLFALAAPLTVLLPQPWVLTLLGDERATDLIVILLLGGGIGLVARAVVRQARHDRNAARAASEAAQAQAALADRDRQVALAELQVLRSQVEPHFLWNTLANVEYLIRKDPQQAHAMMGCLIRYLRSTVGGDARSWSTLGREFESIRAYVGLMQFRMGERFQAEVTLMPGLEHMAFPPLILHTLVENAFKHGLEPLQGAARLSVRGHLLPGTSRLQIEVVDNGVGLKPQPPTQGTGLGLRNVRQRLQALCEGAYSFKILSPKEGGVCAAIEWSVPTQVSTCTPSKEPT